MNKAPLHFVILAAAFFGTWFGLSRVDFVGLFDIEQLTQDNEQKLGEVVIEAIRSSHDEIESKELMKGMEEIKHRLCAANGIADSAITVYVVDDSDVNAFALPARQIVVNAGLVKYCRSPEELAGVMAHEVAHIEHGHVMRKLTKEVGMMMLATLTNGEAGSGIARELARTLSSTAFDREQEEEADVSAVRYMTAAQIDPEPLATFLFRISREKGSVPRHFELLSTHPNSGDRSARVMKLRKQKNITVVPLLTGERWSAMQKDIASGSRPASEG